MQIPRHLAVLPLVILCAVCWASPVFAIADDEPSAAREILRGANAARAVKASSLYDYEAAITAIDKEMTTRDRNTRPFALGLYYEAWRHVRGNKAENEVDVRFYNRFRNIQFELKLSDTQVAKFAHHPESNASNFVEENHAADNPCINGSAEFISHTGPQQIILGNGRVDRTYTIPVYFGYPMRPYRILGRIIMRGCTGMEFALSEAETLASMARAGRDHGCEAIIVLPLSNRSEEWMRKDHPRGPLVFAKALAVEWRMDGPPRARPPNR